MKYLLSIILVVIAFQACFPPEPRVEVVRCPIDTPDLKRKLAQCEERLDYLENRCNPVFGEWNNCEQWVFDRWYAKDPSCEGDIYPPYSEGEEY